MANNGTVIAKKGQRLRKFTQFAWDLLGQNKQGWVQVTDQQVTNSVAVGGKPSTGEQSQPVTKNTNDSGKNIVEVFEEHIQKGVDELAKKNFVEALAAVNAALAISKNSKTAQNLSNAITDAMNAEESTENQRQPSTNENTTGLSEVQKKEWIEKNLSQFTKTSIKDFFDGVDIKYASTAKVEDLKMLLAEYLQFSEAKLAEIV